MVYTLCFSFARRPPWKNVRVPRGYASGVGITVLGDDAGS